VGTRTGRCSACLHFDTGFGDLRNAWFLARPLRSRVGVLLDDASAQRDLDLFWAGACVFVGSYAITRNFDYRLVFCLLTVPQLARWAAARSPVGFVAIAALLGTTWLDGWYDWPRIRDVLEGWSG
jgi:hypothetical protein